MTFYHRKIVTIYNPPPIPHRNRDWCAYDDDLGADGSPYGWGETEREAVEDLMAQLEDMG